MCPMNDAKPKVEVNPQCVLCEFVMKTLSSYVNVNSTSVRVRSPNLNILNLKFSFKDRSRKMVRICLSCYATDN